MKNFSRIGIYILAPLFALFSCGGEDEKFIEKKETTDTIATKIKADISAEVINDIIMSIP